MRIIVVREDGDTEAAIENCVNLIEHGVTGYKADPDDYRNTKGLPKPEVQELM